MNACIFAVFLCSFNIAMAFIQGAGAYDLFMRALNFVGNREIRKIKWEKGFDQNGSMHLTSSKLPATRFVVVIVSAVSCWDYCLKAAEDLDKNAGHVS